VPGVLLFAQPSGFQDGLVTSSARIAG
jgi:hypothetical protein